MNIVRENIAVMNDRLIVKVEPNDYKEEVDKSLKNLKKKANVPGFRAGHVPMGMIERQYGPSVVADEVSKVVDKGLKDYLKENDIRILFELMAVPESTEGDFSHPDQFTFVFEMGLRPEVKVDYSKAKEIPYRKIMAGEEQIDNDVKNLRRRIGKFSSAETVSDEDMVLGRIVPEKEGEEPLSTSLVTSYLKDEFKADLIGKKLHDVMTWDTTMVFKSDYERSTFLKCKIEELADAAVTVKFEIDAIHHVEPAELNEEFFEKAFPNQKVTNESEMRAQLKAQIEKGYEPQEKIQYRGEVMQALTEGMDLELPDAFVTTYIIAHDPNYTAENIDEKYPELKKSVIFQLVEGAIALEGNVNITYEDVSDYVHNYVAFNYLGASYQNLEEHVRQQVDQMAQSMLNQDKTVNNVYDNLFYEKVTDIIREKTGAKVKEVTWDEFLGASAVEAPKAKKTRAKKAAPKKEAAETEKPEKTEKPEEPVAEEVKKSRKTTKKATKE